MISNIWKHPKTTIAGILLGVVQIAPVLLHYGVTLGSVGGGPIVSLAGGLATVLLGMLAKDPGAAPATPTSAAKLSVWALIAILVSGTLPFTVGCSGVTVAQDIVNWTPTLESAVASVDATASLLAPADASIFTAATAGFDGAANVVVAEAKAYLANPSATVLAQLQTAIATLQQQVSTALLQAARIVSPGSQQKVTADINAVATIVNTILSLVASISSKAAVAQMAAASTVKLAQVEPLMDREQAAQIVAAHYREPVMVAAWQVADALGDAQRAGF